MANKLALDELPKRLIVDGKKIDDVMMIYGFVAEGTQDDNITFYLDTLLKTSVIIKDEDIIHDANITKTHSAIGGTIIWVKNASSYTQGKATTSQSQQDAQQFFQGDIYQQYANTVQGNTTQKPQGMHTPVCGCGKCGQ
ncbi:hypothetical protein U8527_20095 [Kordia algicida OT-1]|uniref:Uncharacterized protein n=1 Tax=Kordia algicida OT-1 TaxID=391587 RepID=A9DKC2_9FLAO|nr:hypothetical protein [Kordia algicida]EDP98297.1 hypothetical protein KAOT1_13807 [Kordia algicida OT-1]